jgi:uncharacterized peroxidase-related enzyme
MALCIAADWRAADVSPRLRAMLDYSEKLTLSPSEMTPDDLMPMRSAGLSDEAILHACEVVSYFNFVNRMADGLGVTLESDWSEPILPMGGEPTP